jgi:hypothetical protein
LSLFLMLSILSFSFYSNPNLFLFFVRLVVTSTIPLSTLAILIV